MVRRPAALACGALVALVAACTSNSPVPARSSPGAPASSRTTGTPTGSGATSGSPVPGSSGSTGTTAAGTSAADRVLAGLTLRQRVGQLLMVDCSSTGISDATASAVTNQHVGSVILDGTTSSGSTAIRTLTSRLQDLAPQGLPLFVATDQEGGQVQRLQGPGFPTIPSAVEQGTESPSALQSDAAAWGRALRAAGVTVNLAPVLDTVPAGSSGNPPIGDLQREYGRTPATVTSHGLAFVRGMAAAGVVATAKHFPGLGRVAGNTDTTSGVTDDVTTRDDAYLAPFRAAIAARVPFVMMSTATYARIDADHPAAFSRTIVTGMLRGDLGYRGVIISDDVGVAAQVAGYSAGQRAVAFVRAGGDIVLTVDASQAPAMTSALVAEARRDPAFRAQVDAAARLVLQAKQAAGLL